jgi:hypothetical protein
MHQNQLPPALRERCDIGVSSAHSAPALLVNRRSMLMNIAVGTLASATALASSSTLAPAMPAAPDPIFAAIERHKVVFRISQEAGRIRVHMVDVEWAPEYDPVKCAAAEEADSAASDASTDAANALTTTRPTTMAGALALLRYVEAFNAGAFFLEPYPDSTVSDWQSKPMFWPESNDEDEIDLFGYAVLANVRSALEAMAAVS